jgi:flagellar motor switch protein FliN/FliY
MSQESPSPARGLEQAIDKATANIAVEMSRLDELAPGAAAANGIGIANLLDVPVGVTVEVGRTRITLGDLVRLGPGSLLVLDREAHQPADVLVNSKVVAHGEIVTVDDQYGIRITEVEP